MKLDFDTVIPGHGAVTNKAGLKTCRDNIAKEIRRVRGLIREGENQDDVAKVMTAECGWAPGSLNMQWSLPGMMTEAKAASVLGHYRDPEQAFGAFERQLLLKLRSAHQ